MTLCPVDGAIFGMSWGEDGIAFGQGDKGILRSRRMAANPSCWSAWKQVNSHTVSGPAGREAVLYTLSTGVDRGDTAKVFVKSLKPGSPRKQKIDSGSDARYVSTGHIVYAYGGTLFAISFDLSRLQVTGGQMPVVEGVRRAEATGSAQFGFSSTVSLIYVPGRYGGGDGSELSRCWTARVEWNG